ncbi:MAG: ribosome biogenesis GTPase YqeH [Coprobacillaceae bacterium]
MEEVRCFGCGAIIQHDNENKVGYVPKSAMKENKNILCKRCFKLKNYHQIQKTELTKDYFLKTLQTIGEKDSLVLYIIDVFDFNGSLITGINRHLHNNDILVIGNKRDILPKSLKDRKIEHWLRRQLKEEGIIPVDVILTSGIKNYNLDLVLEKMNDYRQGRDVYVVGVTNVGKSSLINAFIKHYTDNDDMLITTSEFPGTTLDLIEIPLDNKSSLYDSPGIINEHQMAHIIKEEELKVIVPKSELRPVTFQLHDKQTLYFGGVARFDYQKGKQNSFTCYFPKRLKIHRTKLENADGLYNRHQTLSPVIEEITDIKDMKQYEFTLPDYKIDIVISGLGFISTHNPKAQIRILAPKGIGVFLREALI